MGTVVISIDAELGWGHHDLAFPPIERVEYARIGWRRLASLHEEYRLPATWAVVGHGFLENCDGVHADHPTPEGWFARERTSWAGRPDLRFGHDLVELLAESDVDHEIGCHSFSHVLFDAPETTAEVARAEVRASREALCAHPAPVDEFHSFVFPRNRVGHLDVLAEEGFRCYRELGPEEQFAGTTIAPLAKLVRGVAGTPPPLVEPQLTEHGLVKLPSSMYLFGFERVPRAVASAVAGDPIVKRVRRGIDLASREDGVLHLWLHPNNLVYRWDEQRLRDIYGYLRAAVDAGRVDVEPMGEVARRAVTTGSRSNVNDVGIEC